MSAEMPRSIAESRRPGIAIREGLTNDGRFVEDGVRGKMSFRRSTTVCLAMSALAVLAVAIASSAIELRRRRTRRQPPKSDQTSRVTIEVSGGESETPVENASIYVKYIEERKILKDKKLEMNVKTNREGIAHIPAAPMGRVLIQVVADGWKTYGRWYDITEVKANVQGTPREAAEVVLMEAQRILKVFRVNELRRRMRRDNFGDDEANWCASPGEVGSAQ